MKVILVLCLMAAGTLGFPTVESESDSGKTILSVETMSVEKQVDEEVTAHEIQPAKADMTLARETVADAALLTKEEESKKNEAVTYNLEESINNKERSDVLGERASTITDTKLDIPKIPEETIEVLNDAAEDITTKTDVVASVKYDAVGAADAVVATDVNAPIKTPATAGDAMLSDAVGAADAVVATDVNAPIKTPATAGDAMLSDAVGAARVEALAGAIAATNTGGPLSVESNESCICAGAANTPVPAPVM